MLRKMIYGMVLGFLLILASSEMAPVGATVEYPTLTLYIHRVQAIDPIELGWLENGPELRYTITVWDGETWLKEEHEASSNDDDVTVNMEHAFHLTKLTASYTDIWMRLYEMDGSRYDRVADISSNPEYVAGDQAPPAPRGALYHGRYDLKTNVLTGDVTAKEGGYLKTSGDYDGSIETDQNDASIWFDIWDNYEAPVAYAGPNQECYPGEKVNFDGSSSTASSGSSIVRYEWDFENDGIVDAEGEKTSFTYQQKGVQSCRLKVTDSIGESTQDLCTVTVLNPSPIAQFVFSPPSPTILDLVYFVDQSDDDEYITDWYWDFGDGTSSALQSPTHDFSQKGDHIVTLTVTDNNGAQNSKILTVSVMNLPPTAHFNHTPNPRTNTDVQFTDESTDPEDIPLSACLWEFGDGYTSELQNPTHKFTSKGDYDVTLTVWDDENATSTFSMKVSVTEPPPQEVTVPIPLWVIAFVAIVILAIGISAIYVRKRGSRATT